MTAATALPSRGAKSLLRTAGLLASVFKLRIGSEITLAMVAGVAVTPGNGLAAWQLAALGLAVLMSSASAGAFNQYFERDLDAAMARTRNRPFVTGALRPGAHWLAIIALLLVVSVLLAGFATNAVAAVQVFLGAFTYGVIYTVWLKRRTWLNIVFGGLAGSFALLAGALAVDPQLALEPAALAVAMFFWTPPHFWSLALYNRGDYVKTGVPMLPALLSARATAWVILAHTVVLVGCTLVPAFTGLGPAYGTCAVAGGAWFLYRSAQLVARPAPDAALRAFKASLIQLSLLLVGAIVDGAISGRLVS
jgi:protoheme IX farnesyltransferase